VKVHQITKNILAYKISHIQYYTGLRPNSPDQSHRCWF